MGEVGRWIRAKPGAAGSEEAPTFQRKVGASAYLHSKYADSPRPSATPLINAGGKIRSALTGAFLCDSFLIISASLVVWPSVLQSGMDTVSAPGCNIVAPVQNEMLNIMRAISAHLIFHNGPPFFGGQYSMIPGFVLFLDGKCLDSSRSDYRKLDNGYCRGRALTGPWGKLSFALALLEKI